MAVRQTILPVNAPEWAADLVREVRDLTRRVQNLERYSIINTYTIATLPAVDGAENFIFISDETGGFTAAFSDGTNWRRVQDRAVAS